MTNLCAYQVKASNPADYYAHKWTDITVEEMKAFWGVRLSMEFAMIKHRYEFYFSSAVGFLYRTPGYCEVFTRERFLSIWIFLHLVDELDPALDKHDSYTKYIRC